ncbi:histone-lysine N-methyltransferase ATX1 [Melia azedarach]|uniref:Histone-lysine N-methyltransferase ATX1 n=1 Tax=Melia azedarach TaxID=155640 RepID=A0ACC1YTG8_MELAZ|nr:histone-lysine N-methyltransferase ATX1 [Melia azedarach]
MDAKFEALPPLKRFRLMQQQEELQQQQQRRNQDSGESKAKNYCLPAKKRRECLCPPAFLSSESTATAGAAVSSITTYCLPAKKRVWAFQPDLLSDNPALSLDLNVQWKPSFADEKELKEKSKKIPPVKNAEEQSNESIPEEEKEQSNESIPEAGKEQRNKISFLNENEITESKLEYENQEEEEDDGILCAICQSTDGDSTDPIVFCDGCDLMVHASCYGNPLVKNIPEGDWFCAQCLAAQLPKSENPNQTFSCCLCPVKGGAMKPTNNGLWAHTVCAVFVPEVFFEDPEGREGIDYSKVPKTRRKKRCYVCKSKRGCVIECSEPKCSLSFHVTCGLNEDLCIEYREGKKGAVVAGFCKDHTALWKKQEQTGKYKIVARD